jgi:hypothetical protein
MEPTRHAACNESAMIVAKTCRGRWDRGPVSNRIVTVLIPEQPTRNAYAEGDPIHEQQLLELNLGEIPRQMQHPEIQAA